MGLFRTVCSFVAAAVAGPVFAAPAGALAGAIRIDPGYDYDILGSETGMPQTSVLVTLQTRDGYLWVGTQGGLGRYDGVKFTSFYLEDSPGAETAAVRCLFEDSAGTLWIGTESGLLSYRNGVFTPCAPDRAVVTCLAEDQEHTLWVGTTNRGLFTIRAGRVEPAADVGSFPSRNIECAYCDSAGRLWIGFYEAGLACRQNGKFARATGSLADGFDVRSFCEQPRGTLWIGTRSHGLVRRQGPDEIQLTARDGLSSNQANRVWADPGGGLWVMSDSLQWVADPARPLLKTILTIKNSSVVSVSADREGTAWLSARDNGLIHVRRLRYDSVSSADGLSSDIVRAVAGDAAGNLWLSLTDSPLARVAPDRTITGLGSAQGLPADPPIALLPASDGTLWVAYQTSLYALHGGQPETVPGLHRVRAIFEDHEHAIWLGTSNRGIVRFKAGRYEPLEPDPVHLLQPATQFCEGPDGTVYAGTLESGYTAWRDGHQLPTPEANRLPAKRVRALCADADGTLWVGARGVGLEVLSRGQWLHTASLARGLANQVSGILEDSEGQLWLATPAGVMWAKKAQLLAAAKTEGVDPGLRALNAGDAAHSAPAIAGAWPSAWKRPQGDLLFASRRGALLVDPQHLSINPLPPPVKIERVDLDSVAAAMDAPIRIPPNTRVISLEYTALTFVQSNRVLFRYRLEGYESAWIEAGTRRIATYASLPPGNYAFHVVARNSDGIWNETGAALPFTVEPFFWQRTSFRILVVTLFTLAVALLVRWLSFRRLQARLRRLAQQVALDKERSRIARDIHDDVGNRLTEITLLTELAIRQDASSAASSHVRQIAETARAVTDSLDEIVWAVSPRNDTFPNLISYLAQFAAEFFRKAGIACRLELPERPPNETVISDVRHNLYLSVKEAATNVVRHAHATQVEFRIWSDARSLEIELADNGTGFAVGAAGPEGNGLGNLRQRMALVGGSASVESRPGAGTRIRLTLPWMPKN